jgi:hypothetical protein
MKYLLLALLFIAGEKAAIAAPPTISPEKILIVRVNPKGQALMGRDTLNMEGLTKEIKERLWKSFLGTGKMPNKIALQFEGDVLMGTRGAAIEAIRKGQEQAMTEVSIQKYKRKFEDIGSRRQSKMKSQYPVLFQDNFSS